MGRGKFAGEDLGRPIYWDSTEPPSFTFGENHVRPGERGAIIRVSKNLPIGKDKGTPQSFDQLWSSAVFELNNVANSSDYRRIDEDASKGKLARSEYVQRIWQCESRHGAEDASVLHTLLPSLGQIEARAKPSGGVVFGDRGQQNILRKQFGATCSLRVPI